MLLPAFYIVMFNLFTTREISNYAANFASMQLTHGSIVLTWPNWSILKYIYLYII